MSHSCGRYIPSAAVPFAVRSSGAASLASLYIILERQMWWDVVGILKTYFVFDVGIVKQSKAQRQEQGPIVSSLEYIRKYIRKYIRIRLRILEVLLEVF